MRSHIQSLMKTRSTAIKVAIAKYNAAGAATDPKGDPVDWANISDVTVLEDFTFLRLTAKDTKGKPWADSTNRQLMRTQLRVERAHEEIARCKVELRRLVTSIFNEDDLLRQTLSNAIAANHPHTALIHDYALRRSFTHEWILSTVRLVKKIKGIVVDLTRGQREATLGTGGIADAPADVLDGANRHAVAVNLPATADGSASPFVISLCRPSVIGSSNHESVPSLAIPHPSSRIVFKLPPRLNTTGLSSNKSLFVIRILRPSLPAILSSTPVSDPTSMTEPESGASDEQRDDGEWDDNDEDLHDAVDGLVEAVESLGGS